MKKFLLSLIMFIFAALSAFAAEPVKIGGLVFDNSDNIIYLETTGAIDETVNFTKGYLKEPDRIYLDITNSILTTPKKSYTASNSVFNNIKISQFSTDPNTVRLVFEYNKKLDLSAFQVYKTKNSLFIRTNKKLVESPRLKTVYSNAKTQDRTPFFEGAQFNENAVIQAQDLIQSQIAPKNEITAELSVSKPALKIPSKYYINSVSNASKGMMINGMGRLSLIPSFTLQNPDRLIIDLDDTVVEPSIRNKTFALDDNITVKLGQNSQSIARIVIQGENSKDFRAIVSPDLKNLYLTNRANIISAKMSDYNANLIKTSFVNLKGVETAVFAFDDSVSFDVFEENNNLYLDINNLNPYQDTVIDPLVKGIAGVQFTRLALDKLRICFPSYSKKYISVKTTGDNDEIRIYTKNVTPKETPKPKVIASIPAIAPSKKAEISNYFTVVIDAGHGGNDVGATRNNIYEKDITLKIAKKLEEELNKKKVKTYMVRDKDKTVSLAERSEFSNEIKPNVFVSVHVNSSLNDEIKGVETHWWKEDSKLYADYVHKEMASRAKSWNTNDRGLFKSQFYVINHTEAPAILCEIGFISNRAERGEIIKQKRQDEIAKAIADGIYNYLKAKK